MREICVPGDSEPLAFMIRLPYRGSMNFPQFGHFDPRLRLAWDPFWDGKTAIRMGVGIAHDFNQQDKT